ncbi:LuxR C-terminal-related transcriptional regulator [Flaviflexus equikiangi]|uniref:Response regulator transcription factor n=1 Tax=Flaviflexus equikiangi TaxID=2758573 RepID=A0ABS2TH25_9ACTO|nr:LuxR C-terminal-related transcriptional regulator [Flaviflexus equikiangi]MBM9433954.1 response regulator transcription factor [Flaviflexus equikiangi]
MVNTSGELKVVSAPGEALQTSGRASSVRSENSEATLSIIVRQLERLYEERNLPVLARTIEDHLLAAHFGLEPSIFQAMLTSIVDGGVDERGLARGILSIFSADNDKTKGCAPDSGSPDPPFSAEFMRLVGAIMKLRLAGRAHLTPELMLQLDVIDNRMGSMTPLFSDSSGMAVLLPVQLGITALLAGEPRRALDCFVRAQMQPMVPSLAFLTRDAYAKEALLHGAFGRPSDVQRALTKVDTIPRLHSWVEPGIDATIELALAFTEVADSEAAIKRLDSIPLHSLGEMWPFYVIALRRTLCRAGRYRELLDRLASLERTPLAKIPGEGVAGSVFPVARVNVSIAKGDLDAARHLLKGADPAYVATEVALLDIELAAGRHHHALKVAKRIGSRDGIRMWKIDVWRIAGMSAAYLRLEKFEEAREALLLALSGGLESEDLDAFPDDVLDFAASTIDGWPARDGRSPRVVNSLPDGSARLTGREFEILRKLAQDKSQKEIANEIFVSSNTLKTHIKAIYRKLGVSSREAAVLRAEREGWL